MGFREVHTYDVWCDINGCDYKYRFETHDVHMKDTDLKSYYLVKEQFERIWVYSEISCTDLMICKKCLDKMFAFKDGFMNYQKIMYPNAIDAKPILYRLPYPSMDYMPLWSFRRLYHNGEAIQFLLSPETILPYAMVEVGKKLYRLSEEPLKSFDEVEDYIKRIETTGVTGCFNVSGPN